MTVLLDRIRAARIEQGISQADLGRESRVSLATIQNLEAGRGNPSLSTLQRILDSLGLVVKVDTVRADWDALVDHGLPLTRGDAPRQRPTVDGLVRNLRLAAREVAREAVGDGAERKRECLAALVLALRTSFPSTYHRRLRRSPLISGLVPDDPGGRLIKLKRIAEQALAEYL